MNITEKNELFTLSVMTGKYPDMISKLTALLTRRQFDLRSLSMGEAENNSLKFTLVFSGDEYKHYQIKNQINKLDEVISIDSLDEDEKIERETALIKIVVTPSVTVELNKIIDQLGGKIVALSKKDVVIEITGNKSQMDKFLKDLSGFNIKDISRTGTTAIKRAGS